MTDYQIELRSSLLIKTEAKEILDCPLVAQSSMSVDKKKLLIKYI